MSFKNLLLLSCYLLGILLDCAEWSCDSIIKVNVKGGQIIVHAAYNVLSAVKIKKGQMT
jgi:hypothetical protein